MTEEKRPLKNQNPEYGTDRPIIALESRLKDCANVLTFGVRPNFEDYDETEKLLIHRAHRIYYPSSFYADVFSAMGKPIFPSHATYQFAQDKIKQTALFIALGIPHPRTRVFYGKRQKAEIRKYFKLPVIAKVPRGSSLGMGVFLIRSVKDLNRYCMDHPIAYIQEYLPVERDIRIVVVGQRVAHAYWRIAPKGDFRTNVALGGCIDLSPVPELARQLALDTARACGWNDVGLDICHHDGHYLVLEANMKYGREGFRQAGLEYSAVMEELIRHGDI
jgi:ribosomal protein S6--L-glutamate ligase